MKESEKLDIKPIEELIKAIQIVQGKERADIWRRVMYTWEALGRERK